MKQQRRRSSGGTLILLATVALTGTSAFTQQYHGAPRRSSCTSMKAALIDGGPATMLDNSNVKEHLNKKKSKENMDEDDDDEKWELRIYDDKANTREKVARVLVEVTGSSESDAFKTMTNAHKTGVATVGNKLCFEIAEMYNDGLRMQGLLSEIVPVSGGDGSSNSEWE
jgi:ATP-dependent Clp protease adapter protein ClpS